MAVPGLQLFGGDLVVDDLVDAGADFGHFLVVTVVVRPLHRLRCELRGISGEQLVADALADVGPSVFHQVFVHKATGLQGGEVDQPALLPAGLEGVEPLRVDRMVVADVNRRWCALEDKQFFCSAGKVRNALHRGGACANDANPLVGKTIERSARRVAARVLVVPTAGVEGVAAKGVDPGDTGELWTVQRAGAHGNELGAHLVAAVCLDDPAAC